MKHTPGPWFTSSQNTYVRAESSKGWNICKIEDQPPYTEANAKLIAAAPELKDTLIEALKALKMIDNLYYYSDPKHTLSIKSAIQKAEAALKEINPDEDVPEEKPGKD